MADISKDPGSDDFNVTTDAFTGLLGTRLAGQFSTSEVSTGMFWIDDKPVFRKVVDTGALPNSTQSLVAHNIASPNLDAVLFIRGFAEDTNGNQIPLPHVDVGNEAAGDVGVAVNDTVIIITAAGNASLFDKSHVELWYTKV
ncbi:hypothetical protein LCGC14_0583750 [marine sediment metagenome]|uniref:Uncharacterized protein n=1 Tax=marine sediment metagenome TaxID=412755 RepID=A0A0F9RKM1_9ZZZZ